MINNILISLMILGGLLISSFSFYLPLRLYLHDPDKALRYAIPFSISLEIIIGYIFYSFNITRLFPASFLILIIALNLFSYLRLRPLKLHFPKIELSLGIVLTLMITIILYTRYYDAFKFIGPGQNDAYNHLIYIRDLLSRGNFHSNGYYAPGFHLFLMPIAKLIPLYKLYRFTGPGLGIITILSMILLLKDNLKNKSLLLVFLFLLILPVFNQFNLQTIGFFSSALTFIFFPSIIILLSDRVNHRKHNLFLLLIFITGLALTVPYLLVTIIPTAFIYLLIVYFTKDRFNPHYVKFLFLANAIFIFGFIIAFGHVFLQSKILNRYYGFPGIVVITEDTQSRSTPVVASLFPDSSSQTNSTAHRSLTESNATTNDSLIKFKLPSFIENSPFLKPMVGSGYDIVRLKYFRPLTNILSIGSYLWIAISVFLLIFALRRQNSSTLLVVAIFSILLGISTQTGFLEMSTYRGRSGWYLMELSIMGIILFLDYLIPKRLPQYIMALILLISLIGFAYPPIYQRSYFEEEFEVVNRFALEHSQTEIKLITYFPALEISAPNLHLLGYQTIYLENEDSLLALEKKSKISSSETAKLIEKNEQMTNNSNLGLFSKYFENSDFVIYEYLKK